MNTEKQIVILWIRYAENDLRVAESALDMTESSFHTICYLCGTATEKFLKGYLIAHGWELDQTEDLLELLNLTKQYTTSFEDYENGIKTLNRLFFAGQYPNDIPFNEFDRTKAEAAIQVARQIHERTTSLIGKD
ncbi:MAG: HEPN domain-containing protein [Chloroflexi bacterium]|nr:HEPN domain-containing protein [Chloroflexota bacterium]